MKTPSKRHREAKWLRAARRLHRVLGGWFFALFFVIALSSILLGWKKHSSGWIQQPTHNGVSTDLKNWLPLDSLHTIAVNILRDSVSENLSTVIDRIDVRKEKGVAKFIFTDHFFGIQLDGTTGELLLIEYRRSDLIESIHDGAIFDRLFGSGNGIFKLIYSTINGLALLTFVVTGFWLWYGPKRLKNVSSKGINVHKKSMLKRMNRK